MSKNLAGPARRTRKQARKPEQVEVTRAPQAAIDAALELAGGDSRRLRVALEPDGRVSVTVVNKPRHGAG